MLLFLARHAIVIGEFHTLFKMYINVPLIFQVTIEGQIYKFYKFINFFNQLLKKFSVHIGGFRCHLKHFFLLSSELTSVMMMNPNWSSQYQLELFYWSAQQLQQHPIGSFIGRTFLLGVPVLAEADAVQLSVGLPSTNQSFPVGLRNIGQSFHFAR